MLKGTVQGVCITFPASADRPIQANYIQGVYKGFTRGIQGGKSPAKQPQTLGKSQDTAGMRRRRTPSLGRFRAPPHPHSLQRSTGRYELRLTWRCVPRNQICSGRGAGAGCQSKARSTIWCIRSNHQREVNVDGGRMARGDWAMRTLPRLSSNCVSFIISISLSAPSVEGWVGQPRSNPYKYGYGSFAGSEGRGIGDYGGSLGRGVGAV